MPSDWNLQAAQASVPKNVTLSGIFSDAHKSSAIINEKNVSVGDFIQGYEVVEIGKNAVHLKNIHGTFMVPLDINVLTPVVDNKEKLKQGIKPK